MPVYQYQCKNCENIFEESHSVDDREVPLKNTCSGCGENSLYIALFPIIWGDSYRLGFTKPKGDFVERIQHIKKRTPGNTIEY